MRVLLVAALLALSQQALACGYCVEDKIAAVYDHATVTHALAQKHQVAFFHVEGALAPGAARRRRIGRPPGWPSGPPAAPGRR